MIHHSHTATRRERANVHNHHIHETNKWCDLAQIFGGPQVPQFACFKNSLNTILQISMDKFHVQSCHIFAWNFLLIFQICQLSRATKINYNTVQSRSRHISTITLTAHLLWTRHTFTLCEREVSSRITKIAAIMKVTRCVKKKLQRDITSWRQKTYQISVWLYRESN